MAYYMNFARCKTDERQTLVLQEAKRRGLRAFRVYHNCVAWKGSEGILGSGPSFRKWLLAKYQIHGDYVECTSKAGGVFRLTSLPPDGVCNRAWFLIHTTNEIDYQGVLNYVKKQGWLHYPFSTRIVLVRVSMPTTGKKFSRWLRRLAPDIPDSLRPKIEEMGIKYGLDPAFICGVIQQESNWDVDAIGYGLDADGKYTIPCDYGIMQINKMHQNSKGFNALFPNYFPPDNDYADPLIGIEAGCYMLSACYKAASGTTPEEKMLNAYRRYNGGPTGETKPITLERAQKVMAYRDKFAEQLNPQFPTSILSAYVIQSFYNSNTKLLKW